MGIQLSRVVLDLGRWRRRRRRRVIELEGRYEIG
jgi:hypothetical protein